MLYHGITVLDSGVPEFEMVQVGIFSYILQFSFHLE